MKNRYLLILGFICSSGLLLKYFMNGFSAQSPSALTTVCDLAFSLGWICFTLRAFNIRKEHASRMQLYVLRIQTCLSVLCCLIQAARLVITSLPGELPSSNLLFLNNLFAGSFVICCLLYLLPKVAGSFPAALSFVALCTGSLLWCCFLHLPGTLPAAVLCFTLAAFAFGYVTLLQEATYAENENLLYEMSTL